jgi:hypothetical protein
VAQESESGDPAAWSGPEQAPGPQETLVPGLDEGSRATPAADDSAGADDRGGLPLMAPDGAGLRFSFEVDLVGALEAIGRPLRDWDGVDHEAEVAAENAAQGWTDTPPAPASGPTGPAGPDGFPEDREPADAPPEPAEPGAAPGTQPRRARDLAGAVAEVLPTGPGLAAWLAGQDPAAAADGDLVAMAGAFRRVASWAQARELDLIAHVAARSAAADPRAGLQADGRPAHVTDDAAAQVSLELALSRVGAEAWAGLAVALRWRLPRTAAALAEGRIDTYRAKILAEAVIPLSDEAAIAVEDQVIPVAGDLTYAQMHAAVRRAVIAADPEGAEHRRQAAERRAKVSLYPDQDGTASLVGACLPAPEAAAAFARISAIANAMKAAGAGGGLHFLRAQVLLGKLLDTLPVIPPPADGPPDAEPPPDDHDDHDDHDDGWTPEDGNDGWTPSSNRPPGSGSSGPGESEPPECGSDGGISVRSESAGRDRSPGGDPATGPDRPADGVDPWPDMPPLTDADLPADDGGRDARLPLPDGYAEWDPARGDPLDDHFSSPAAQWPWPLIPPAVPATLPAPAPGRPPPAGQLDLALPWDTFTGIADIPGTLGRVGPITAPEGRRLASLAFRSTATEWRIILTDADHRAIAVARVPRARQGPARIAGATGITGTAGTAGIIGRVTIVMPADALDSAPASRPRPADGSYARILAAARRARDQARQQAEADRHAPGGCAHTTASPAYSPPPRIREQVAARDQTCRHPRCGQPAWRCDLDHTIPYDQGGRTCPCDLGALCRRHHQLKQQVGWTLAQPCPGTFRWTTPAGRVYTTCPDPYPAA